MGYDASNMNFKWNYTEGTVPGEKEGKIEKLPSKIRNQMTRKKKSNVSWRERVRTFKDNFNFC